MSKIAKSAINWVELAERVPMNQKANFNAFKTKSDSYLRRVTSNPEALPAIDWDMYTSKISAAQMVSSFKSSYESLKIPYPEDKYTSAVEAQAKQAAEEVKAYVTASEGRVREFESKIKTLETILPFNQMTMEDYKDAFPDSALDTLNRPTFWPHTPEDQLGYKAPDAVAEKH